MTVICGTLCQTRVDYDCDLWYFVSDLSRL